MTMSRPFGLAGAAAATLLLVAQPAHGCNFGRISGAARLVDEALGTDLDRVSSAISAATNAETDRETELAALGRRASAIRSQLARHDAMRPQPQLPRLRGNVLNVLGEMARNARRYADPPYVADMRRDLAATEREMKRIAATNIDPAAAATASDAVIRRLTSLEASSTDPLPRLAVHSVGANIAEEISRCFGGARATSAAAVAAQFDRALLADAAAGQGPAIGWVNKLRDQSSADLFEQILLGRAVLRERMPAVRQAFDARQPRITWLEHFPAHDGADFGNVRSMSADEAAGQLVTVMGASLFSDDRLHCEAPRSAIRSSNPQAQTLLDLASARTIVLLAHGFAFSRAGWRYTGDELQRDFADIIALGRRIDPGAAYCTVSWNSEYGIDESPRVLPDLYLALRLLTDHPDIYRKDRTIAMVGHSAGGNLVKYSYILARGTLSEMDRQGLSPTRTRIVTLGTPHMGAKLANMGVSMFASSSSTSLMAQKARTRGATKMQTLDRNPDLARLNSEFEKVKPVGHVFGFAAVNDEAVEESSAVPSFLQGWRIQNKDHNGLLVVEKDSPYARLLEQAIAGQELAL